MDIVFIIYFFWDNETLGFVEAKWEVKIILIATIANLCSDSNHIYTRL